MIVHNILMDVCIHLIYFLPIQTDKHPVGLHNIRVVATDDNKLAGVKVDYRAAM